MEGDESEATLRSQLNDVIEFIETTLKDNKWEGELSFCHNDLLLKNLLFDEEKRKV